MTPVAALLFFVAAAGPVEISLAPDQPIPHVYAGDPLVLELVSKSDLEASAVVTISRQGEPPHEIALGLLSLRADEPYWTTIVGVPVLRGLYRAHIALVAGQDSIVEKEAWFSRIDCPNHDPSNFLGLNVASIDADTPHVLRGVPIGAVRLPADLPDIESHVRHLSDSGLDVTIAFDLLGLDAPEELAAKLGAALIGQTAGWDVDPAGEPGRLQAITKALRRGGSKAPVSLVVRDSEALDVALATDATGFVSAVVLLADMPSPEELAAIHRTAEAHGLEGLPVHVVGNGPSRDASDPGPDLTRQLFVNKANRVARTTLGPSLVYADGRIQVGYAYLSAMTQRFSGTHYVGNLASDPPTQAHVFRSGDAWTLALWSTESGVSITLNLGDADGLSLVNARNNPMPAPELREGDVTFVIGPEPCYLSGHGGNVLASAARRMAWREADAFLNAKAYQEAFPAPLMDVVKLAKAGDRPHRSTFFALLRVLPGIEADWHAGKVPATIAAPALGSLGRLVRHLCTLEQEVGPPFSELIDKTIETCNGYKSKYLMNTGPSGAQSLRGEWLLAEVDRLMAASAALAREGRTIEASGVAAVAEWRARALEVHY